MKSFFNFLKEARTSSVSDQAQSKGLTGDGHGNWYDKEGNRVAVTSRGTLKMLPSKEPPQEEPSGETQTTQQEPEIDGQLQGEFGTFGDGKPRRMPAPSRADGSPKEDLGPLTVTFGRFNPPTVGHQKLLDAAKKAAGKGSLRIYPSRSHDPKKNPYDPDEKIDVMKQMYPDHAGNIVNDPNSKTIFDVLKQAYEDGFSSVKIVVGGDRVKEFTKLSGDYNGKLYDFSDVETVSAGERDPDAEGVEGMSASKMRKAAMEDDFETYRTGIPDTIDDKTAKMMMTNLKKRMQVTKESWNLWEIAPKFDWKNLRENYIKGRIFKLDGLVENLNTGLVGKVIRRGTNYLICVTEENVMFKSWIRDIREYSEVKMKRKMRDEKHPNTLIGTDGYLKNVQDKTPGYDYGKQFINKYRKK
jgi:hypothetical protein